MFRVKVRRLEPSTRRVTWHIACCFWSSMTFGEPLARGGAFLTGSTIRDCFTYEDLGPEDAQIAAVAEDFVRREVLPHVAAIEAQEPGLMRSLLQKAGEL